MHHAVVFEGGEKGNILYLLGEAVPFIGDSHVAYPLDSRGRWRRRTESHGQKHDQKEGREQRGSWAMDGFIYLDF